MFTIFRGDLTFQISLMNTCVEVRMLQDKGVTCSKLYRQRLPTQLVRKISTSPPAQLLALNMAHVRQSRPDISQSSPCFRHWRPEMRQSRPGSGLGRRVWSAVRKRWEKWHGLLLPLCNFDLIAAGNYARYPAGPSIRPICTRCCLTMTYVIQACGNSLWARVFVINTRPDEIFWGLWFMGTTSPNLFQKRP